MPYSKYLPAHMGAIRLISPGPFVAGSHAELVLVYTAGTFGIDDTGPVKISWRTTSDMSKPQFNQPQAANFTTVEASNGAVLEVWFDRLNIRRTGTEIARRSNGEDDARLQYALEWGFFTRCQWGEFDTALYELERCWGRSPESPSRMA